jgi:hypothetical protein
MRMNAIDPDPSCPECGQRKLTRVISGFAIHKSISTIHEESGEPGSRVSPDYYKDPRNIGRHIEKRFKDMNIEFPSDVKKSIEAAREGELPESVKDLNTGASQDSAYH